jgi:hypothetical protein
MATAPQGKRAARRPIIGALVCWEQWIEGKVQRFGVLWLLLLTPCCLDAAADPLYGLLHGLLRHVSGLRCAVLGATRASF